MARVKRVAHPVADWEQALAMVPEQPAVPMGAVDTAWLRMDSPHNLMMINGVWTLSPGITWEALCERVQQRLLQYPRFRQRVVEDAAGATWVEDRNFDIANHVTVEKLPRHARGQAQQALLHGGRQLARAQRQRGGLVIEGVDHVTRRPGQAVVQSEERAGLDGGKWGSGSGHVSPDKLPRL